MYRSYAAGVIARAGATVDRMDEIKMAVEEACGCLLDQVYPPRRIALSFSSQDGGLLVRAEALDAEAETGDADDDALEIMTCILSSLAEDVRFEIRNGFIAAVSLRAAL